MQHETGFGLAANEVKRRHILPKALAVGLVSGLLASAFRIALDIRALPAALMLGLICGLGGVLFNRALLKSLDF